MANYYEQLSEFKYFPEEKKYPAHFKGICLVVNSLGQLVRKKMPEDIDVGWMFENFSAKYVHLCMEKRYHYWPVPAGNHEGPDNDLLEFTEVPVRYQQKSMDFCLYYSVSSAMHYCGQEEGALKLSQNATCGADLPLHLGIKELYEHIREHVPRCGNAKRFGTRGHKLNFDMILENRSQFPLMLIPYGHDMSIGHTVCIVDDLIFDSRFEFALKLNFYNLHFICGPGGMLKVYVAYLFHQGFGCRPLDRKMQTNF